MSEKKEGKERLEEGKEKSVLKKVFKKTLYEYDNVHTVCIKKNRDSLNVEILVPKINIKVTAKTS